MVRLPIHPMRCECSCVTAGGLYSSRNAGPRKFAQAHSFMENRDEEFLLQQSRLRVPGWAATGLEMALIEKGGSDRNYHRVAAQPGHGGPASVVLMVYTDLRPDNKSFFPATEVLRMAGARAPEIYHHDAPQKLAWLEDLGLGDLWESRNDAAQRLTFYRSALQQVALVHNMCWDEIPELLRSQLQPPFDEALYAWEQDYFFTQFAARFSVADAERLKEIRAGEEFAGLCRALAALPRSMVHRDFQSQNVIIRDGEAWMIDYQGLREGRPEYDLASLLYDPYVALTADERAQLCDYYFNSCRGTVCDPQILAMCACQRLMQALGAYGKLGAGDGKTAFLQHIRPAVENLREVLHESGLLPGLEEVLTLRPGALLPPSA